MSARRPDKLHITSRGHAKGFGVPFYYDGKPCKNSHHSYRNTKSNVCDECARVAARERNQRKLDEQLGRCEPPEYIPREFRAAARALKEGKK